MANIAIKRMVMGVRVIGMLFGPKNNGGTYVGTEE